MTTKYYEITEFDYNDVFSRRTLDFDSYDAAVDWVKNQFAPDIRDKVECIGGDPESYVYYFPVSDEDGNEVKPEDPRYEALNEEQELRVQLGYTIEELEE